MAKGYNQKLKLLYIIKLLMRESDEQHPIRTSRIIEELEKNGISAERKSIYDDIAYLIDYGYDIVLNPSKRNGGYYMASRDFELPELKILVDSVQSSRFITAKKSRELIEKLESLGSVFDAKELKRHVYVANRIKSENESIYYTVNDIYEAIQKNRQISFAYLKWKGLKGANRDGDRVTVSPFTLAISDNNYYLIAYDGTNKKIKHYRVDRIKSVYILDTDREGEDIYKSFDVVSYINKTFNMFAGVEEKVIFTVPEAMAGIFLDRFGDNCSITMNKGLCEIRATVAVSPQFFGWVTGLGNEVIIREPEYVAKDYKKYLEGIIAGY